MRPDAAASSPKSSLYKRLVFFEYCANKKTWVIVCMLLGVILHLLPPQSSAAWGIQLSRLFLPHHILLHKLSRLILCRVPQTRKITICNSLVNFGPRRSFFSSLYCCACTGIVCNRFGSYTIPPCFEREISRSSDKRLPLIILRHSLHEFTFFRVLIMFAERRTLVLS